MWELPQQRLMKLRSSWRDKLYSRVTILNWIFMGLPFVKVIMCVMCVLAYISHNLSLGMFDVGILWN